MLQNWSLRARCDTRRLEGACGQVESSRKGLRFIASKRLGILSKSVSFLAARAGKSLHGALPGTGAGCRRWRASHRVTLRPCWVGVWERCCAFQASAPRWSSCVVCCLVRDADQCVLCVHASGSGISPRPMFEQIQALVTVVH